MSIRYRPEIDGLRTIAVLSVLVYHAKFVINEKVFLGGGFLGVDMFFVISGFLITSLIQQEWARTGRFSILDFYERRARRLLPALFVVIVASWPVAWFLLMPSEMVDFVKSQLASVFFVSNMYWWDNALTYGGRSGLVQPFLHTWSLAVEEQFYIVFPLFYLALLRFAGGFRQVLNILLAVVIAGLLFAEYATRANWDLSFYWLPSRIWELMVGAALAHLMTRYPKALHTDLTCRLVPLAGLILVLVSMWTMTLKWHHPGFGTVATVVGTALFIWFATPRDPLTRVLSSPVFVGIGLISYSLYLWHYPIFAFGRMIEDDPGFLSKVVWFYLSFLFAILSFKYVEKPFRNRCTMPPLRLAKATGGGTALIVAFALAMLGTDGLRDRFPRLVALYGINEFDMEVQRDITWVALNSLAADHGYDAGHAYKPSDFERNALWFSDNPETHKVLLVGNSHSKDMFNAFHLNADRFPGMEFSRFGMSSKLHLEDIEALLASPNFQAADTIALTFRYALSLPRKDDFAQAMKASGKQIILMLNTVEFEDVNGLPLFDWYLQESGEPFDIEAMNALAWERRDMTRYPNLNADLHAFAAQMDAIVLDRADYMCDRAFRACTLVTPDGYKALFDYGHYSAEGAEYFGRVIAETGWFDIRRTSEMPREYALQQTR